MIIRFISEINNNGNLNKVDFKAPVTISEEKEFTIYEFEEPSRKEMNRIEISDSIINIMAGPSTLEMELNKDIEVLYKVGGGMMIKLITHLKKIEKKENLVSFNYELKNIEGLIGVYKVSLELTK